MSRFLEFTVPIQLTGSITVPRGSTRMIAEAVGGGGAGTTGGSASGGGGGGAYARSTVQVTSNQLVYYSRANSQALAGGDPGPPSIVSFNSNLSSPIVQAAGGGSGITLTGGTGGTVAASIGDVRFAGGNGGNGQSGGGSRGGGSGGASGGPFGAGGAGGAGSGSTAGALPTISGGPVSHLLTNLPGQINDAIFANNIYVACVEDGIYSSTDAITWTRRQLDANGTWKIIYTGTNFVVGSTDRFYTSSNGTTWTSRALAGFFGDRMAHNNAGFVIALGSGGSVATSPDHGVTWTRRADFPSSLSFWQGIAYFSVTGRFYASANNDFTWSTTDGINWSSEWSALSNLVQIDNFLFGCDSNSSVLVKTPDGITFQDVFLPADGPLLTPVKTPLSKYIVASGSNIYLSFDTVAWYRISCGIEYIISGSPTVDLVAFQNIFDFVGTNPTQVYRFTLTKNAINITDVGKEVNYADINLIPGGRGATNDAEAGNGSSTWGGAGGGGGFGTGFSFVGLGSNGKIRIHFNPRRKIVS